jgi:4-hydroxy-tetrahydrodipicolinate reductase
MKIALIGFGKMGQAIEEIALQRKHTVVLKIDHHNLQDFTTDALSKADVAIEFTRPEAAAQNILKCFDAGVPVVCGTTGWLDKMEEVKRTCLVNDKAFFYASNYSIGVNIFFEINRMLAGIMNNQPQYKAAIEEIHHVHKLDSPSGTAITLAQDLMHQVKRLDSRKNVDLRTEPKPKEWPGNELPVVSYRIDEVPGTHRVHYDGPDDELIIIHQAKSRRGFAEGAVLAAEWIAGKKGFFGMKDLLNL